MSAAAGAHSWTVPRPVVPLEVLRKSAHVTLLPSFIGFARILLLTSTECQYVAT